MGGKEPAWLSLAVRLLPISRQARYTASIVNDLDKNAPPPGRGFVSLNGRLTPAAAAMVPVFDRGFAYGDSLVETMKLIDGRPAFFTEHYRRLSQGCADTGIPLAPPEELWRCAVELSEANCVTSGRLRLQLSRGVAPGREGLDPGPEHHPVLVMTAEQFAGYPESFYGNGMVCATVDANRGAWASLKTASLMTTIMARRQALAAGADEALFTSAHGALLEGAFTNIFFFTDDECRTAAADAILPGVIRGQVLAILKGMGVTVEERAPALSEAGAATAAFLTGSLLGFCPVRQIDDVELELDRKLFFAVSEALRLAEAASVSRTYG